MPDGRRPKRKRWKRQPLSRQPLSRQPLSRLTPTAPLAQGSLWALLRRAQREIGGREAADAPRGARSARPVGEAARSKPNEAGRAASELASDAERPCRIVDTERSEVRRGETPGRRRRHGAKMQDDYCELWIACSPPPHSLMRVLQWKIHIFRFRPANPQSALRHPGRQSAFSSRAPGSKRWWAAR